MSESTSKTTTDHNEIQEWATARGGIPMAVASTGGHKETGIIRIGFPDAPHADDGNLEEISWDDFFEKFDVAKLALIYQEKTADGHKSNFSKLVSR